MQRVVRSTLVGFLTLAGLTACGDKVTIPPTTTTPADASIHAVLVSPSQLTLAVGGKAILAASVDAGPAATNRTVTWSSSDATVASVGTDGTVTGVKAGTVTITASSAQDPTVKGAAAVTVGGTGGTGNPTIAISSINQTNAAGQSVPANLAGVAGQLDIVVNVDWNGQTPKTVSVSVKSGAATQTQTQTLSSATTAAFAAEESTLPYTFSFNTAAFNATTGVPVLLNNAAATITATATSTVATTPSASTSTTFVLANVDGVLIVNSFAAVANAEGITPTVTQAADANGLPWRTGSITVTATPVLYSGRTLASVLLTVPGATAQPAAITAAPFAATWSASASSGTRVTGQTLYANNTLIPGSCPAFGSCFEANGVTPLGITPTVIALDNVGNDLGLAVLNPGVTGATFRFDATAPQAPTTFQIAARQVSVATGGWVNASYTFTGTGGATFAAGTGTTKFVACGDGPTVAATAPVAAGTYACNPALPAGGSGVSAGTPGTSGLTGLTTFTYYTIAGSAYSLINANLTSTSATACSTTGWTKMATGTGADLAGSLLSNAYVVRVFETDKLGNARCTDLAPGNVGGGTINAFSNANAGKFGVDKIAPVAAYQEPASLASNAPNLGIWNLASVGTVPVNFTVNVSYLDDASQPSGFLTTPLSTMVNRLFVDPATLAPSNFNTANGCPSGLSNGVCAAAASLGNLPGWYNATAGTLADASGCVGCGYYVFTQNLLDQARNTAGAFTGTAATTLAGACGAAGCRQVLIDVQAPAMGGIAVPSAIVGGTTVAFATSANDNLDLGSYDYSLLYPVAIAGGTGSLPVRSPATSTNGQIVGTAFDNVLTTNSSFALNVPTFIRDVQTTTLLGAPVGGVFTLPSQITGRVYDAAGNPGVAVVQPISAINVPQAGRVDFSVAQPSTAVLQSFKVSNVATNISNGPATTTAANPTTVALTVQAVGSEGTTFQYINPFVAVQYYYLDPTTSEWILIGSVGASTVTDNPTLTARTFTWTLTWDPPAALLPGATNIIAVGINAAGDALVTANNTNITLTNP